MTDENVKALAWVEHKIKLFEGAGETENLDCLYTIKAHLTAPSEPVGTGEAFRSVDNLRSHAIQMGMPNYDEVDRNCDIIKAALTRPKVDVEALRYDNVFIRSGDNQGEEWNDCIDHLQSQGYLQAQGVDALTIQDYEECLADKRRLARQIDVILNGEDGAAKQASLCDLIPQIEALVKPQPPIEGLREAVTHCEACGFVNKYHTRIVLQAAKEKLSEIEK